MKFGYVRISTPDQKFDLQIDALIDSSVLPENIYKDVSSGMKAERKGLDHLLSKIRPGDEIVVWKLDRIARSVIHLAQLIQLFEKNNISFKSLKEPFIDTGSAHGKFIFTLFSAVAQLERDIISERTKAGLVSARKRGRHGGRKPGLSEKSLKIADKAVKLYNNKDMSIQEILEVLKVSKKTFYDILRFKNVEIGSYVFRTDNFKKSPK